MSQKNTDPVDRATLDGKAGGTVAGGTAGAVIGGLLGGGLTAGIAGVAGAAIGAAVGAMFDDREYAEVQPEFRHEWERGPYKESAAWDQASSAYQHGWDNGHRPEYRGRSWDEVRPELETSWAGAGSWSDWEPLARRAWERRSSGKGSTDAPA